MTPAAVLTEEDARGIAISMLTAAGAPGEHARLVADAIVYANLRGVDSHGLQLLPHYVDQLLEGDIDPCARGTVVSESGACLLYDGGHGLGHVTADVCCGHAVRLAQAHGISIVVTRETSHFGAAAFWAQRISAAGLIGIAMCDASAQVPPWQGRAKLLGTNPIAVSVPHPGGRGWLLDMATSTVALGKLEQARLNGKMEIPQGWALDAEGRPTTEMNAALAGFLMPLGGYKGSGLAMLVEILGGVLGGGAIAGEVRGIRQHGSPSRVNHTFLGIDVGRFLPVEEFYRRMDVLVERVKALPRAAGFDQILVAGDPEWRSQDERRERGIPVLPGPWEALEQAAAKLKVRLPGR